MDLRNILAYTDHIQLSQTATWEDIKKLIDEAVEYKINSVFVPPSYVKRAVEYAKTHKKSILEHHIGTVIGFPNGYSTTETKVFETREAIKNGAREIALVININEFKNKYYYDINYFYIENEIRQIQLAIGEMCSIINCDSRLDLTVIIETSLLTEEEKIAICRDIGYTSYIQLSTGFTKGRTTFKDIKLIKKRSGSNIKVAGEFASLDDAFKYLNRDARRIFTSGIINLVKQEEAKREKFTIEEDVKLAFDCLEDLPKDRYTPFNEAAVLTAKNGKKFTDVRKARSHSSNYVGESAFRTALSRGEKEFSRIVLAGCIFPFVVSLIHKYVMLDYCDPKTFEVVIASSKRTYEVYTLKELLKFKERGVGLETVPGFYKRRTNYGNEYNTNYANKYNMNYSKIRLKDKKR